MTYKISSEQLKWLFESPACRGSWQMGDAYCAMSKIAKVCLGDLSSPLDSVDVDGSIIKFKVVEFLHHYHIAVWGNNESCIADNPNHPVNINDSKEGFFLDNHRRAIKVALQEGMRVGLFELEDELAHEFLAQQALTV